MTDPAISPTRPTRAKASTTKPSTIKPNAAKPTPAKAGATKPSAMKPSPARTTRAKATAAKPTPAKASSAKPSAAKATRAKPSSATPSPAKAIRARATTAKPHLGLPARSRLVGSDRAASLAVARRVVELAEDKKAADIVLLDLGELTTLADAFVICSGGSERQLDAIADGIVSGLRDEKVRPIGREGVAASHWVLLDFGGVIVHIFTPPERDFYELEKHWSEAKTVLRVQ